MFAHSKDLALSSKYKIIEQTFLDDGTKLYLAQKICGFGFMMKYVLYFSHELNIIYQVKSGSKRGLGSKIAAVKFFPLSFQVPTLKEGISNVNEMSKTLSELNQKLEKEINDAFDELVKMMNDRRNELVSYKWIFS